MTPVVIKMSAILKVGKLLKKDILFSKGKWAKVIKSMTQLNFNLSMMLPIAPAKIRRVLQGKDIC